MHRAVIWDDSVLTEPVPAEVEAVLRRAEKRIAQEAAADLEALGVSIFDIAQPEYRRIIPESECPIFAALQRKHRL